MRFIVLLACADKAVNADIPVAFWLDCHLPSNSRLLSTKTGTNCPRAAMYNGIGLLTPRGSGTSGYVQTNKFNIRGPPQQRIQDQRKVDGSNQAQRKPDQGILDHNRRREIELKCVQMADALEEQGYG